MEGACPERSAAETELPTPSPILRISSTARDTAGSDALRTLTSERKTAAARSTAATPSVERSCAGGDVEVCPPGRDWAVDGLVAEPAAGRLAGRDALGTAKGRGPPPLPGTVGGGRLPAGEDFCPCANKPPGNKPPMALAVSTQARTPKQHLTPAPSRGVGEEPAPFVGFTRRLQPAASKPTQPSTYQRSSRQEVPQGKQEKKSPAMTYFRPRRDYHRRQLLIDRVRDGNGSYQLPMVTGRVRSRSSHFSELERKEIGCGSEFATFLVSI